MEKIWRRNIGIPNPKILLWAEKPAPPAVPLLEETILAKKAEQKFSEAMSMGSYLTEDMKLSLMNMMKRASEEEPIDFSSSVVEIKI